MESNEYLSYVVDMFSMQGRANTMISGECWIDGKNSDGQEIDWNRAIYMELCELIDCFQYKWWKANKTNELYSIRDNDNVDIELVDIWHFIMSELIRLDYCKVIELSEFQHFIVDEYTTIKHYDKINSNKDFILRVESIMKDLLTYKSMISLDEDLVKYKSKVSKLLRNIVFYYITLIGSRMTFTTFHNKYLLKNVLNIFRLENGYQDGSYSKEWSGKEDNEYLTEYINSNGEISYNVIMEYLTKCYKEAM